MKTITQADWFNTANANYGPMLESDLYGWWLTAIAEWCHCEPDKIACIYNTQHAEELEDLESYMEVGNKYEGQQRPPRYKDGKITELGFHFGDFWFGVVRLKSKYGKTGTVPAVGHYPGGSPPCIYIAERYAETLPSTPFAAI